MSRLLTYNDSNSPALTKNGTVELDTVVALAGTINSFKLPLEDGSYEEKQLTTVLKRAYFIRFYWRYTGTPSAESRLAQASNVTAVLAWSLRFTTGKKLKLVSSAGAKVGSESAVIEPGEWVRIELEVTVAESGNSKYTMKLNGTTVFSAAEGGATNEAMKAFRFGRPSSAVTGLTAVWIGPIAINDDQGESEKSFPGEYVAEARRRVQAVV